VEEFDEPYPYRRREEEAYKRLKAGIEVEDFSAKGAISVRQGPYAKVFLMSLCAIYAHPIEVKV
jgi:hypothetical protein